MRQQENRIYIAVKGIVIHHHRTLILRRAEITDREWWEFPGGTLEFGEHPQQTLSREMREETGLEVAPERLLYVWSVQNNPGYQIIIITYLCACDNLDSFRLSQEHSGYLWASKTDLQNMLADDIKQAIDANHIWHIFDKTHTA